MDEKLTPQSVVPETTSFFKAIMGTCAGTVIFKKLLGQSLVRAGFHIFALLLLSGIVISYVQMNIIVDETQKIAHYIDQNFGNINFTEKGIYPALNPNQSTHIALNRGIWFDYIPSMDAYNDTVRSWGLNAEKCNAGILWDPQCILMWVKTPADGYMANPIFAPPHYPKEPFKEPTLADVRKHAQKFIPGTTDAREYHLYPVPTLPTFSLPVKHLLPNLESDTIQLNPTTLLSQAVNPVVLLPILAFFSAFSSFILVGFLAFIFSASSYIFSDADSKRVITFSRMLTLTLYAACPAIIIATLWELCGLRILNLDYAQIILYALLVYSLVVQFKMQRMIDRKPPPIDPDF